MRIADLRNIKYFLQMTFLAKKTIFSIVCEKKLFLRLANSQLPTRYQPISCYFNNHLKFLYDLSKEMLLNNNY